MGNDTIKGYEKLRKENNEPQRRRERKVKKFYELNVFNEFDELKKGRDASYRMMIIPLIRYTQ